MGILLYTDFISSHRWHWREFIDSSSSLSLVCQWNFPWLCNYPNFSCCSLLNYNVYSRIIHCNLYGQRAQLELRFLDSTVTWIPVSFENLETLISVVSIARNKYYLLDVLIHLGWSLDCLWTRIAFCSQNTFTI